MTVSFTVPGKHVTPNQGYQTVPRSGRAGMILSKPGRDWKERVAAYAFAAAQLNKWPDAKKVTAVDVTISAYNSRADVDSHKLTIDALQGAFFANDSCIETLMLAKGQDEGAPRVEITVALMGCKP
jgi:Holliday junction resolvase RusA-like endonuclease